MDLKINNCLFLKSWTLTIVLMSFFLNSFGQITADFSAKNIKGCAPLVVQFTDNSAGAPDSLLWNFGNGNNAITKNPSAIYSTPGIYTVTLKISKNGISDTETKTAFITVFSNPIAEFATQGNSFGCAPFDVGFINKSVSGETPSAPVEKWLWSFGDGNSSIIKSPSHQYKLPDKYTVTLQVTDTNGCKNTYFITDYISTTKPTATFTANPLSACSLPAKINFTNTSSGKNLKYKWNFGDNQTAIDANPAHEYAINGKYSPELIITDENNCTDTLKKDNYLTIKSIKAEFVADKKTVCVGDTIYFSDLSDGTSIWSWNFGDGAPTSKIKNPSHQYSQPGTYSVLLDARNDLCASQEVKTAYIQVNAIPNVSFSSDKDSSCVVPFEVEFNNTSLGANSYLWDYGDKKSSPESNTLHKHSYDSIGVFNVSLTATSPSGCSNTLSKSNFIKIALPIANFSSDIWSGCVPLPVNFNGITSTANEKITDWEWDFGDGSISNSPIAASYSYASEGVYDAKLTIKTASNCTQSFSSKILAGNKPTAEFSFLPSSNCIDSVFTFSDKSIGMTGTNKQWIWDFESTDQVVFGQNVNASFRDTGIFDARLIVENNGCRDTLILKDTVKILGPKALFNYTQSCRSIGLSPYTVAFKDASILGTSWTWDFGDSNSFSGKDTLHTYDSTKTYQVTLTVTDSITGCANSYTKPIQITDPVVGFIVDTTLGCYPFSPLITDTSKNAVTYLWSFGNGTNSNTNNPQITFSDTGYYNLSVVITDLRGCKDSLKMDSLFHAIGPKPNFEANNLTGCRPLPVNFIDKTFSDSTIIKWQWDFGDNSIDSSQNPNHIYTDRGSYPVKLAVTDTNQCSATKIISNFIEPTFPFPSFTVSDSITCKNKAFVIKNTSTGKKLKYLWTFGDGNTSDTTAASFNYKYSVGGIYNLSLKLTDDNGCDSTLTIDSIIEVENPHADFSPSATLASCPPFPVSFINKSSGLGNSSAIYSWIFGDNTVPSDLYEPLHFYNIPGNYTLKLSLTTAAGCHDDTIAPGLISLNGPFGTFEADTTEGCKPFPVSFSASASNTANYIWDFGNGNVQITSDSSINHLYTSGGKFIPTLILDDGLGCNFSVISPFGPITVNTTQYAIKADTTILCRNQQATLSAESINSGTKFTWSTNSGINCADCNLTIVKPDSSTTFYVDIFGNKCPAKDSITINVKQLPIITISNDTSICSKNSFKLFASGGTHYSWSPSLDLDCDTCPEPIASPQTSRNYMVLVRDSFCLSKDSVLIKVSPSAVAKFSAEPKEGIIPLKVNFENQSTSADTVHWLFGNGRKSIEKNPTYTYKDTGTYTVMLIANNASGCPDTAEFVIPVGVISSIKAPNVFTPNNDGINDFFTLNQTAIGIQELNGTIFNRWGGVVAIWKDPKTGWNGRTDSDVPAPEGTYFYVIKAIGMDGIPYLLQGYVSLIR